MKTITAPFKRIGALVLAGGFLAGCCSPDGGDMSGSAYYGVGFYDSWYYGGYYDDVDIVVTPPDRPTPPPRPTHPIAPTPAPRPTPMPSIPSTPRPSFRR